MTAEPKRVEVVAALLCEGGRLLVQRRPVGKARAQLWEFPGGKRENAETPGEALERECLEELGLTVRVGGVVWSTEHRYDDLVVHLTLFRCQFAGTPEGRDGQELRWATTEELSALEFVAADRPVIDLLQSGVIAL